MEEYSRRDISTLIGIALALAMVMVAVSSGGNPGSFIDMPSIMIVVGGTVFVTIASFSFHDFLRMPVIVFRHTFRRHDSASDTAIQILELAEHARKKGLLSLQQRLDSVESEFLRKGLAMVVDGIEVEDVERTMRQEVHAMSERHNQSASVLRKMAEIAPAMGLMGTVIGLIQMLGNLDDPSKIGPAMALALITTFYGVLLAYVICTPLAAKLERSSAEELLLRTLYLRGVSSMGRKENPRRLEMLLNAVLPPSQRVEYF